MYKIDLNADVGESFGEFKVGEDDRLIPIITSANIACGLHAGDYRIMDQTVALCKKYDVKIGAHIGFNDIFGFGRRQLPVGALELKQLVSYQLGALYGVCKLHGVEINHVKLHGALYNTVANDLELSSVLIRTIKQFNDAIKLYGLSGSENERASKLLDHPFYAEVFSDRAYQSNGQLVSRSKSNAMITNTELIANRMINLVKTGKITAEDGETITLKADTICIHGDQPDAADKALKLKNALITAGVVIKAE
ncbi:LamB/YcsF family protein [Fusibacter bizertensis]